jgi:hypothetical protein
MAFLVGTHFAWVARLDVAHSMDSSPLNNRNPVRGNGEELFRRFKNRLVGQCLCVVVNKTKKPTLIFHAFEMFIGKALRATLWASYRGQGTSRSRPQGEFILRCRKSAPVTDGHWKITPAVTLL